MAKTATKSIGLRATAGKRTLRFGLVSVGVSMGPALDTSARVSGKYVDPVGLSPVKQQYVNALGEVVTPIRAYPYGDGFITLDEAEVPKLDGTDVIELTANIPAADVPAEWITGTNLAWPTDTTQDEGYALVAHYLRANARVFIGKTVTQGTTKVLAVRWSDAYGCLVAQTLAFHAQVRWMNVEAVRTAVAAMPEPAPAMAAMAAQLFDNIEDDFAWDEVADEYGEALNAAIAEKGESGTVTPRASEEPAPSAGSLMAALQASLDRTAS